MSKTETTPTPTDSPEPEPSSAPKGWKTGKWAGETNYQCPECPYATLDLTLAHRHAATAH